jgi:hypothetical protein
MSDERTDVEKAVTFINEVTKLIGAPAAIIFHDKKIAGDGAQPITGLTPPPVGGAIHETAYRRKSTRRQRR